jgi:hypothetical protein
MLGVTGLSSWLAMLTAVAAGIAKPLGTALCFAGM